MDLRPVKFSLRLLFAVWNRQMEPQMMTVDNTQHAALMQGLSDSEAHKLLATFGPNALPQKAGVPLTTRFLLQSLLRASLNRPQRSLRKRPMPSTSYMHVTARHSGILDFLLRECVRCSGRKESGLESTAHIAGCSKRRRGPIGRTSFATCANIVQPQLSITGMPFIAPLPKRGWSHYCAAT